MWLHDFYWMAALKPDGSAPLTKGSLTQIREMLGAYKDARKKQLKGKRISHILGSLKNVTVVDGCYTRTEDHQKRRVARM